jgi:hypothetical protein
MKALLVSQMSKATARGERLDWIRLDRRVTSTTEHNSPTKTPPEEKAYGKYTRKKGICT